jgi:hypothetical protein
LQLAVCNVLKPPGESAERRSPEHTAPELESGQRESCGVANSAERPARERYPSSSFITSRARDFAWSAHGWRDREGGFTLVFYK